IESLRAFPAITQQEFSEACRAWEQRSSDRISETDWLSVRWTGEELLITQRRKITCKDGKRRTPSDHGDAQKDELIDMGIEDSIIKDTLAPDVDNLESLIVDFSITLSPIYSVPVLWFICRYDRVNKALSLDQIYEWLVPEPSLTSLRGIGVMGGISMAHHPVSDRPTFFLHPCKTQEALSVLKPGPLTPEEYLMLWLGLIGSAVGLHVPSKLMSTW
ncbi:uncharacterized protein A1O5_00334, partial [Cladophialophora psammophila CBS 110553]